MERYYLCGKWFVIFESEKGYIMKYYAKFLPLAVGFSIILYGLRSYMSADGLSLQHYIVYNHCGELIKFQHIYIDIFVIAVFIFFRGVKSVDGGLEEKL